MPTVTRTLLAIAIAVTLLMSATKGFAYTEPSSMTVHSDGGGVPLAASLPSFFTLGDPLAFVDWLCLGTDSDLGPSLDMDLARLTVQDEDGNAVGRFASQSGAHHRFRPYHHAGAEGVVTFRYCTRVLPRAWSEESVRIVTTRDASRLSRATFALDGDSRGCRQAQPCGALTPRLTGFAYGSASARFTYGALGFWQSAELEGGTLGRGVTRFRAAAFVPLLYLSAGSPTALRVSAQAGLALPITIASTDVEGGGSALGAGLGAYWAQCFELRTPVAPSLCLGAQIDGAVEGALRGGALDDVRPRIIFAWYVALGAGR